MGAPVVVKFHNVEIRCRKTFPVSGHEIQQRSIGLALKTHQSYTIKHAVIKIVKYRYRVTNQMVSSKCFISVSPNCFINVFYFNAFKYIKNM